MSKFNLDALVKELARRAKIGNGQDYRHAQKKMTARHAQLRGMKNVPDH